MVNQSTYPIRHASTRRDCAIPAVTAAAGAVSWSRELRLPDATVQPVLLVWEGRVLAASYQAMALFTAGGERIWERGKGGGTPVAVANGLLYCENQGHYLDGIGPANNVVLDGAYLPGVMSAEYYVTFLWPREKDFLATVDQPDPTYDSEGGGPIPRPEVSCLAAIYGEKTGTWTQSYSGRQRLAPIFVPALGRLVVYLDEVIAMDAGSGEETSRFRIPLEKVADWSADAAGTLCLLGYLDGQKALLAMNLAGDEQWRWVDSDESDRWAAGQPPLRSAAGRVYALTEGRVLAFDRGRLLWTYDARSESLRHGASITDGSFAVQDGRLLATGSLRHASVLADDSLLVTDRRTVRRVDRDGRKVFSVDVGGDILTPPVVDAAGNIYVATAERLVQIR